MKSVIAAVVLACMVCACAPVQPYQKAFIHDEEMQLNSRKIERFGQNALIYREGTSGASGGRTGGGCGCN